MRKYSLHPWAFAGAAAGAIGISACAEEDGVNTGVLRVDAVNTETGARAPGLSDDTCVRIPVLLGGRRDVSFPIDGELTIVLHVERDTVDVFFRGASDSPSPRTLERIEATGVVDLDVRSATGTPYVVSLSGTCEGRD